MALVPASSRGWCVLTLITFISVKNSKSDIMLNQFQAEFRDWREKMPKTWHEYIKMYFYNLFQNKMHFLQGNVIHMLMRLMLKSKSLIIVSNKRTINIDVDLQVINKNMLYKLLSICLIYHDCPWRTEYWQQFTKYCLVSKRYGLFLTPRDLSELQTIGYYHIWTKQDVHRCLEKQPIGQFFLHFKTLIHAALHLSISVAHWKLDHKLRLNLTFTTLYIPNAVLFCHPFAGSTSVSIISDYYCKYDFPLKFCGHYSTFSFYPNDTQVILCWGHNLTALFLDFIEHQIEGMFMIMDAGQLVNIPDVLLVNPLIKPELVYDINSKHQILRFFISVKKLDKIILNGSITTRYVVFDGPGLLSDIINTTARYQITSTYQCLVLLLESREGSFKYFPKHLSVFNNISINQTGNSVLNFPNKKCMEGLCISLANADVGFQLNVTAITVKSKMPRNVNCLYAGIVTGERLSSENREARTICECDEGQAKSFYTYKSSLIIVVYWYSIYSRINSSVMISQTKCKLVIIDLCFLGFLILHGNGHHKFYLNDLNKFSNIKISIYFYDHLSYEIKAGTCAIVQFFTTPNELYNKYKRVITLHNFVQYQKPCGYYFTPKNAVNIQVRLPVNRSEMRVEGKIFDVCKNIQSCPTDISEPLTPRMMLEYREWNSSIGIWKDASLRLTRKKVSTNGWTELIIQSSARNSVNQLNLSRFAIDFVFDKKKLCVNSAVRSLNTKSSTLLLKSNTKSMNPNASLTVNIFSWEYYEKQDVPFTWESTFQWYQLKYKKYISLMGHVYESMRLNWLEVNGFTPRNNVLMVMWINNNYIRFSNLNVITRQECLPKNKTISCANITVQNTVHHKEYYYSIAEILPHKYYHFHGKKLARHKLKTWEEASNWCNDLVGGHLPIFNNKDNLHTFLSLLKLSGHLLHNMYKLPGVYIGLKFNATNVSKINYVQIMSPVLLLSCFKYGHPQISWAQVFRLYLSQGVTAVVHGFTVVHWTQRWYRSQSCRL